MDNLQSAQISLGRNVLDRSNGKRLFLKAAIKTWLFLKAIEGEPGNNIK